MKRLVLNLRGTNGSGKTTLARSFLPPDLKGNDPGRNGGPVDLVRFPSPTKRDPQRRGSVIGYGRSDLRSIVVGSYETACGGLDTIDNFGRQQAAITAALRILSSHWPDEPVTVLAEGILASTVYGSWARYAEDCVAMKHETRFAFVYLHTPLDVCLDRIRARQEAAGRVREIKRELVADKVKAILATRNKALRDGHLVYDLPIGGEQEALHEIARRKGEAYRAA